MNELQKYFEKRKAKYKKAGKTADWLFSWENAFWKYGGGRNEKQSHGANPKRRSPSNPVPVGDSRLRGTDSRLAGSGRQGLIPSAGQICAGKGAQQVSCPSKGPRGNT